MEPTKERIRDEALRLFSVHGYDAVSVEMIAQAVGIKAPSLYKHYKSKQAIFDAIFTAMEERYGRQTEEMMMHLGEGEKDETMFSLVDGDALVEKVLSLFRFSLHDPCISRFRKLMTIEQFRDKKMSKLYDERYVGLMMDYHEKLFTALMEQGILVSGDVKAMTWQYVSPIITLLSVCDREPEREADAVVLVGRHIRQFRLVYGRRK